MNFYYDGALYAINHPHFDEMPPVGKTRLSVYHYAWGTPTGPYNTVQLRRHLTDVKYGTLIQKIDADPKLEDFVIN